MQLLEFIFRDRLTAQFLSFYLPFLGLLLLTGWFFGRPRESSPRTTAARRHPLASKVAGFGKDIADALANSDVSPNQVTCLGLILVLVNCALFLVHRDTLWFGTGLILSLPFDALDGLIARRQGRVSRFGAYLDAVVDRWQEIAIYAAIGWVLDEWALCFFAITGSMLTSYNKARAAMEMAVDNKGWPDLLDRNRRMWLLCFGLMGDASIPWLLEFNLACLAVLTNFTAVQRFIRVKMMLTRPGLSV